MKILNKYMRNIICLFGFERKDVVDFCLLCEECKEGIIPFEFVQKVYYRMVRGE